jgi:NAD(P)-dependent dehydrogenase (short-subunit alcohol dehydrogenase family)
MAKTPRSLVGKVVAITGGARGIGRATAAALIAQGAKVAIGDIDQQLVRQTAQELGHGTFGSALDVTERTSFEAFLDHAERELGPLDVLVNNAGIMPIGVIHRGERRDGAGSCRYQPPRSHLRPQSLRSGLSCLAAGATS